MAEEPSDATLLALAVELRRQIRLRWVLRHGRGRATSWGSDEAHEGAEEEDATAEEAREDQAGSGGTRGLGRGTKAARRAERQRSGRGRGGAPDGRCSRGATEGRASLDAYAVDPHGADRTRDGTEAEARWSQVAPHQGTSGARSRASVTRAEARSRSRGAASGASWGERFATELRHISAVEGGQPPVVVESEAVDNVGTNGRLVVVNPRWMDRVEKEICGGRSACARDLVRGIAGHEWGHVVQAREGGPQGSPHERELDADRTAGRVLARTGGSVGPLMELLEGEAATGSSTHPDGARRAAAVLAGHGGWGACRGEGSCSCEDCLP